MTGVIQTKETDQEGVPGVTQLLEMHLIAVFHCDGRGRCAPTEGNERMLSISCKYVFIIGIEVLVLL